MHLKYCIGTSANSLAVRGLYFLLILGRDRSCFRIISKEVLNLIMFIIIINPRSYQQSEGHDETKLLSKSTSRTVKNWKSRKERMNASNGSLRTKLMQVHQSNSQAKKTHSKSFYSAFRELMINSGDGIDPERLKKKENLLIQWSKEGWSHLRWFWVWEKTECRG